MPRRGLAAALGLLAVAAVVAGTLVLTNGGGPAAAPPPVVTTTHSPPPSSTTTPSSTELRPEAVPVRHTPAAQRPGTVRLPEGGTATLVRREVTPDGTLPIPDGLQEATWWGAELGAGRGVALLSGHVNWAGRTGPFEQLWRSHAGQDVTVVDAGGGRWVYRVTDVLTLHKDDLPAHAPRLFAQDGPHRLVLVTCGGDYVGGTDGYEDNRIVVAELITRP